MLYSLYYVLHYIKPVTLKGGLMSAEKISDLDKRLTLQEANWNRALLAVEKQTNSIEKLSECVSKQTVKFDYLASEVKELKLEVKEAKQIASDNETEIAVIKRGSRWMDWAEKSVIAGIVGAIVWAMQNMGS